MRLVFGTLDLPDTDLPPRLLERYVEAGGRVLDVANVHQPDYVLPVVGTTPEAHLDEALGAGTIRLDQAELAWLESGENR